MTDDAAAHAIILAGGRATRMGGVDKPAIVVGGQRMLDTAIAAVSPHCGRVVVVGPHRDDLDPAVLQSQESPQGGGPVAAVATGMIALTPEPDALVVLLASDLPFARPTTVRALVDAVRANETADAAFAVDDTGRIQFLLSVWRAEALREQIQALGSPAAYVNQPMKTLMPREFATVRVSDATDCDTPEDLERARSVPVTIEDARRAILAALPPMAPHTAVLSESFGATLAEALISGGDLPRFDVSAMDGFAVAGDGPWTLRTEIRYAGSHTDISLVPGEAVRIATGAHLPTGADAVLRDEFAEMTESMQVARRGHALVRDDVRRRGEDWSAGHRLASQGTPVTPALVSVAASAEVTSGAVRGPVHAHVVVTGDEIRRDGPLREGQTRDALGPVLSTFLSWCGVRTTADAHLRDTSDSFDELLRAVLSPEVIVIIGATGGGAADQLRAALDRAGARTVVGRVLCRPGGSQVTAVLPDGRVVLGLPGNPYAAVATLLTMMPAITAALTGRSLPSPLRGRVANAGEVSTDTMRILPVTQLADGDWYADLGLRTAHLAALIGRDALALIPAGASDGQVLELITLPH